MVVIEKFEYPDLNMFDFLVDTNNRFFEKNGGARMSHLRGMYIRGFKADLDLLDINKLLDASEKTLQDPTNAI